jgi:hypothetical protein
MKFKVFMDTDAAQLETRVNGWLDQLGRGAVIKTETVITAIADKPNDGTHPCVVVTIWYELPSN